MFTGVREHLRAAFTGGEDAEYFVQQNLKALWWRLEELGLSRAPRDDADAVAVQAVQSSPSCVRTLLIDLERGDVSLRVESRRVGALSARLTAALQPPIRRRAAHRCLSRGRGAARRIESRPGRTGSLWHYQVGTFTCRWASAGPWASTSLVSVAEAPQPTSTHFVLVAGTAAKALVYAELRLKSSSMASKWSSSYSSHRPHTDVSGGCSSGATVLYRRIASRC